jgi:magnesium-transporting ATPase (P-type)
MPLLKNMMLVFFILFLFDMAQEASGLNRYLVLDDTKAGNSIYYNLAVENGEPVNIINEEITNEGHGDPFLMSMIYLMAGIMIIIFIIISFKLFVLAKCGFRLNKPGISVMCRIGMSDTTRNHTWLLFIIELIIICGINAIPIMVTPIIRKDTIKYTMSTWLMIGFIFILQLMFQFAGITPNAKNIQEDCKDNKNRDFTKESITMMPTI